MSITLESSESAYSTEDDENEQELLLELQKPDEQESDVASTLQPKSIGSRRRSTKASSARSPVCNYHTNLRKSFRPLRV